MNSASRDFTVRVSQNPLTDHLSAFRTALDLFGAAELADFLPAREDPRYLEVLGALVRVEMAHAWTPTAVETYRDRYPELFADAVLAYQIVQQDFQLRQKAGEAPTSVAISPLDP